MPDETTICKFRHFLEAHGLTETLFRNTKRYLSDRGMWISEGTIRGRHDHPCAGVDEEQGSEKGPRDALPEEGQHLSLRHEGPRGQRSQGAGAQCGDHPASVHDSQVMEACLHGKEESHLWRQGLRGRQAKAKGSVRRRYLAGASQGKTRQAP